MTTARPADSDRGRDDSRFRTMYEQSPVSTQVFAPDGETIAVNRAWEKLWGVTLEQAGGYNVLQDEQLARKGVMPLIQRAFAGEAVSVPAMRYDPAETADVPGAVAYRWVKASLYPVLDEDGSVHEVVVMHEDITEQRDTEEALQRSEERLRAMFYGAPVGLALIDGDGRYLAVNPVRAAMLGYTEEELRGRHYLELTHVEDVEHDQVVNREAQETGLDRVQLEKRFVRRNGTVQWTRITAAALRDPGGAALYSISVAEDITAQRQAEEERARLYALEREARIRWTQLAAEREAMLGQIAEGVIITDPEGRITFVNQSARRLHGVSELGISVEAYADTYHLFTVDGRPYPTEELPLARAVIHGETVLDAEWVIQRPDGTRAVAQGSAVPVTHADGHRLGAVLTVRDVTTQHQLQVQKDQFLSAVAHDLRTPLTSVKGRVQMLRRRAEMGALSPEQLADGLERIEAGSARMVTLINELLEVANIQLGRPMSLTRESVDLVRIAESVGREHQHSSERHTVEIHAGVPEVIGQWDTTRLERVLANLLSNAIKYSPEGGKITVTVDVDGGSPPAAILRVSDEGVGIPGEDLPHVFERFHRGRNVTTKIAGTGIGLAAVREIVEQHGGTVTAESTEGTGSTFTLRLPMTDQSSGMTP